jgi:hypothetical protein
MLRTFALGAPLALLLSGCMGATSQQLRRRAAFDLDCPAGQIEIVEIDKRTRGVRGCGQRGTYVSQCKPCANGYVGCECTWILNTDGRRERAGRASVSP